MVMAFTGAVLVTGATGKLGGATARSLLQSKAQVHALVRSPSSPAAQNLKSLGAVLHHGDFDDVDSIQKALSPHNDITAIFLNVSPSLVDPKAELRHATNVVHAAQSVGTIISIVYPSIFETGRHETFPGWATWDPSSFMVRYWLSKASVENLIRSSGFLNWTILRPPTFMSNYHNPSLRFFFPELPTARIFRTALTPETRTMLIAPEDIGRIAAAVISRPKAYAGREIDIGAEALTPGDITAALSRVSGQELRAAQIPREEAEELAKTNMGIHAQLFFNERSSGMDLKALKKEFPELELMGFEEYLRLKEEIVKASIS